MGNFIGKHVQAVNAQSLLLILESTRLRSYGSKKCYVRAEFPSSFKMFSSLADTGWSKETVNCNFSLTDMKIKKNGKTQTFLEMAYSEVLIFWCLRKGRWKNSCLLGLGQNSELAPVWANPSWSESPKTPPSSSGIPKISPRSIDTRSVNDEELF